MRGYLLKDRIHLCADELLAAQQEWEFNDTDYNDRTA